MSYTGPFVCHHCGETWEKNPLNQVVCPTCFAKPGSPCMRPSGHEAAETHVTREQACLDAGLLSRCPAAPPLEPSPQEALF